MFALCKRLEDRDGDGEIGRQGDGRQKQSVSVSHSLCLLACILLAQQLLQAHHVIVQARDVEHRFHAV